MSQKAVWLRQQIDVVAKTLHRLFPKEHADELSRELKQGVEQVARIGERDERDEYVASELEKTVEGLSKLCNDFFDLEKKGIIEEADNERMRTEMEKAVQSAIIRIRSLERNLVIERIRKLDRVIEYLEKKLAIVEKAL